MTSAVPVFSPGSEAFGRPAGGLNVALAPTDALNSLWASGDTPARNQMQVTRRPGISARDKRSDIQPSIPTALYSVTLLGAYIRYTCDNVCHCWMCTSNHHLSGKVTAALPLWPTSLIADTELLNLQAQHQHAKRHDANKLGPLLHHLFDQSVWLLMLSCSMCRHNISILSVIMQTKWCKSACVPMVTLWSVVSVTQASKPRGDWAVKQVSTCAYADIQLLSLQTHLWCHFAQLSP